MLPVLLEIPKNANDWQRWSFHHRDEHRAIRQAIQSQIGVNLPEYQLDPINGSDTTLWLQNNAQSHGDMNGALHLPSVNLLDVHFDDPRALEAWIWLHYQEHFSASAKLQI